MKRIFSFIFGIWVALFTLVSCNSELRQVERVQRTLTQQLQYAQWLCNRLENALVNEQLDSIAYLAEKANHGIIFYTYKDNSLQYWSDSWLSSSYGPDQQYDRWLYREWNNAQGLYYHTRRGRYRILMVIPVKYHYSFDNDQLHNDFIPPFCGKEKWTFNTLNRSDEHPICGLQGEYLFSMCYPQSGIHTENRDGGLASSFSFNALTSKLTQDQRWDKNRLFPAILIWLCIVILCVVVGIGIGWLVKYKGFKYLPLAYKIQMLIVLLVVLCCVSNYVASVHYSRTNYVNDQHTKIRKSAELIQLALRSCFFWDTYLPQYGSAQLNQIISNLSRAYGVDINIYNTHGILAGTSTPALFDAGLSSHVISPRVFFNNDHFMVLNEHIGDLQYVTAYADIFNGHYDRIGYVAIPVYVSHENEEIAVNTFVAQLLPTYVLVLILAILFGWLFTRILAASLGELSRKLQSYKLGEQADPVYYPFHDEVRDLVDHYNALVVALNATADKLAKAEREEAWRTMARQVAHEINNALTPMKLIIQQVQRVHGTERFDEYFDKATHTLVDEIDVLSHIASSFSSFAKMPEVQAQEVDIAVILSSTLDLCRANTNNIPIRYVGAMVDVKAWADPTQIGQVILNIVRNATQALEHTPNPIVTVSLLAGQVPAQQHLISDQDDYVQIRIADNGPGIPESLRDKVFIPNFTTKNTGAGLGLAFAKNVVESSGGIITYTSSQYGTTFYVYLKKPI